MYVPPEGRYGETGPVKQRYRPLRKGYRDQDKDPTGKELPTFWKVPL